MITDFELRNHKLVMGDGIAITNMKGEETFGRFNSQYENGMTSFSFENDSNGKTEEIVLASLQSLRITFRVSRPNIIDNKKNI